MPTPSDPAQCEDDEQLYECVECGKRLCSAEKVSLCSSCGAHMRNLTKPRPQ